MFKETKKLNSKRKRDQICSNNNIIGGQINPKPKKYIAKTKTKISKS